MHVQTVKGSVLRVLIVGTGLSALATYLALKKRELPNAKIDLIDANNRHSLDTDFHQRTFGQKRSFSSSHMYATSTNPNLPKTALNLSFSAGGFSNVWGAGIRLWEQNQVGEIIKDVDDFYRSASKILKEIPFFGTNRQMNLPSSLRMTETLKPKGSNDFNSGSDSFENKIKYFDTPLAVSTSGPNSCRSCGLCLQGCPYGSIFDSSHFFDSLVARHQVHRIDGFVTKFHQSENAVEVFANIKERREVKFLYDRVYLCAGAIGTPLLLINSGIVKSLAILDSHMFYFGGFRIIPKRKKLQTFALSQKTITNSDLFSASIYSCSSQVRDMIVERLFKSTPKLQRIRIPRFLDSILFFGIGFLHSDVSGQLIVKANSKENCEIEVRNNSLSRISVKKSIRIIRRRLFKEKLIVLPIFVTPGVGTGFHNGGATPLGSPLLNANSSLQQADKVFVSDVSTLPKLFPGSHTLNSMALNFHLINKS